MRRRFAPHASSTSESALEFRNNSGRDFSAVKKSKPRPWSGLAAMTSTSIDAGRVVRAVFAQHVLLRGCNPFLAQESTGAQSRADKKTLRPILVGTGPWRRLFQRQSVSVVTWSSSASSALVIHSESIGFASSVSDLLSNIHISFDVGASMRVCRGNRCFYCAWAGRRQCYHF